MKWHSLCLWPGMPSTMPCLPLMLWEFYPACSVRFCTPTAQFSKSSPYFLDPYMKILQLSCVQSQKCTTLPIDRRKKKGFHFSGHYSQIRSDKVSAPPGEGTLCLRNPFKGSFPEKGKVHRYSPSEHTVPVPKWWQVTLALPSRLSKSSEQGWPQKQQVSVSQCFFFKVKDRPPCRNRSWR